MWQPERRRPAFSNVATVSFTVSVWLGLPDIAVPAYFVLVADQGVAFTLSFNGSTNAVLTVQLGVSAAGVPMGSLYFRAQPTTRRQTRQRGFAMQLTFSDPLHCSQGG